MSTLLDVILLSCVHVLWTLFLMFFFWHWGFHHRARLQCFNSGFHSPRSFISLFRCQMGMVSVSHHSFPPSTLKLMPPHSKLGHVIAFSPIFHCSVISCFYIRNDQLVSGCCMSSSCSSFALHFYIFTAVPLASTCYVFIPTLLYCIFDEYCAI